jgi:MerR family transcriptional regulator, light-induced transcriptional regulator
LNDRQDAQNSIDMHPLTLSIAAVERDTGLSKDTLRIWERRYGFPQPLRDAAGERAYDLDQVEKLRVLKRLMDGGHRPGRVVRLPLDELLRLSDASRGGLTGDDKSIQNQTPRHASINLAMYVDLLREHDVDRLRRQMVQASLRMGLARFVTDLVAPLNALVGEAWMRGQLQIFEEHIYTESVQVVLRESIQGVPHTSQADRPRVLLTTFPGEPHALGMLMAEALLALEGAKCIALGVQTPLWDIVLASRAYQCDVVALSFSGCMNPHQITEGLIELRSKLPAPFEIWAGGAAPVLHRRPVEGIHAIQSLTQIHEAIQRWRSAPRATDALGEVLKGYV